MTNALHQALNSFAEEGREYLNLIDSDFHANGFLPDPEPLKGLCTEYFDNLLGNRAYKPEARGSLTARRAISRYYEHQGVAVDPEHLLLTASSSEAYSLLFTQIAEPGNRVLLPLPGYPLFEELAGYAGLEPDFYPLDPDCGWQPELDVLESLIQPTTRFIIIISPNNPTGSLVSKESLTALYAICQNWNIFLIIDEVFRPFVQAGTLPNIDSRALRGFVSPGVPKLPGSTADPEDQGGTSTPGQFIINGISKLCASPDLKLSWIWHHNIPEELAHGLELANDTYLNCNSLSQHLLPELLNQAMDPAGVTERIAGVLRENHHSLLTALESRPDIRTGLEGVESEDSKELLAGGIHRILIIDWLNPESDEALALFLLEKFGVLVHPGYLYGIDEWGAVVLSLLKEPGVFSRGLERLVQGLANWRQEQ